MASLEQSTSLIFARLGVGSFDSTSPLRQAFKDDKDNYYTLEGAMPAIRIPQVEGNPALGKAIAAGRVPQGEARELEQAALAAIKRFDAGKLSVEATVKALVAYEDLFAKATGKGEVAAGRKVRTKGGYDEAYRRVLKTSPWKTCKCDICPGPRAPRHSVPRRGAKPPPRLSQYLGILPTTEAGTEH